MSYCKIFFRKTKLWIFLFTSTLLNGGLEADTLFLKDGSVIHGTIVHLEEKLKFTPSFQDEMSIEWDTVAGLATDNQVSIELSNGRREQGQFIYESGGLPVPGEVKSQWQLKQTDGTIRNITSDELKMIWPAGEEDPISQANKTKWTVRLSAGITGETGTNERVNFFATFDVQRKTPNGELDIYGRARFSQENNEISSNELIGGIEYDYNLSSRLSVFVKEEIERDRFENLNYRSTTTSGLAYKVFDREKLKWQVKLGTGIQYEEQVGGATQTNGVIDASETLFYQFSPHLEFNHKIEFYPELEDFGDRYRATMENGVVIPIIADKSWQIRMGIRHAYNKNPGGTAENLDTFYYANVVWDLK